MDLTLNNLQKLIRHKTQPTNPNATFKDRNPGIKKKSLPMKTINETQVNHSKSPEEDTKSETCVDCFGLVL